MTLQTQLTIHLDGKIYGIDTRKKTKKSNKTLKDSKIRRLCADYQNEIQFLWNSDPDRQGKAVYDSGEVDVLNAQWEKDAVRRDLKKGLIRVWTQIPVMWSEVEGKWIDKI